MNPDTLPDAGATASPRPADASDALKGTANGAPHYVSFILRCQTTPNGGVRARLAEVSSGVACAVSDLDDLPDLVRDWIRAQMPSRVQAAAGVTPQGGLPRYVEGQGTGPSAVGCPKGYRHEEEDP